MLLKLPKKMYHKRKKWSTFQSVLSQSAKRSRVKKKVYSKYLYFKKVESAWAKRNGHRAVAITSQLPKRNLGLVSVFSGSPVVRKTIPAVNRSFWIRFERHFCLNVAVRTGCFVHFSRSAEIRISSEEVSVIKSHLCFTFVLVDSQWERLKSIELLNL